VLKNGEPYLMLGGSGGPRIISSALTVMLGVLDAGHSLEEAMRQLRPHHQWKPDLIYFDKKPGPEIVTDLVRRGHEISEKRRTGVIQAILRTEDGWVGASDPRKGGIPAGY
jgi:gamma-glutamyltranspeptidase/glutathione hydrolase